MHAKKIDVLALMLYCGFIFWLSSRQTLPVPMWFSFQDKLYHAGAYAVMAVLAWRCFRHFLATPIILALASAVFVSLYGASDEWHQSFVPGRSSGADDWLADTLGGILGVWLLPKQLLAANPVVESSCRKCAFDCPNCSTPD